MENPEAFQSSRLRVGVLQNGGEIHGTLHALMVGNNKTVKNTRNLQIWQEISGTLHALKIKKMILFKCGLFHMIGEKKIWEEAKMPDGRHVG